MHYEGPIYRPPSEANSLLVQATIGCPHNRCTFCMVYKNGPRYRVRPVADIINDLDQARALHGRGVRTLFFPAGNTIAMPTDDLCRICAHARRIFPHLARITVYGSSQYIHKKGPDAAEASGRCRVEPHPCRAGVRRRRDPEADQERHHGQAADRGRAVDHGCRHPAEPIRRSGHRRCGSNPAARLPDSRCAQPHRPGFHSAADLRAQASTPPCSRWWRAAPSRCWDRTGC